MSAVDEADDALRAALGLPPGERTNWFHVLSSIDCKGHTEEKNGFTYLSWPYAISVMTSYDPAFDWGLDWFNGLPYLVTPAGVFVQVWTVFHGRKVTHLYPVLDYKNNPVPAGEVNAFDINTSQMRGMVKCVALQGLGLYIFDGKTAPGDEDSREAIALANRLRATLNQDLEDEALAEQCLALRAEFNEQKDLFMAAWSYLAAKERRAFKEYCEMAGKAATAANTGESRR